MSEETQATAEPLVTYEQRGGVAIISMNRPGVRNAQDAKAMRSTFGQQVRALRMGDRRGRRGRRPAGE